MSEHTPGDLEIFDQGPRLILASPEAGWSVCSIDVVHSLGRNDEGVHRANAGRLRLGWNVHDEMLAALKIAKRQIEMHGLAYGAAHASAVVNAAIAKAEGRAS
jgi:hypothetical protein